MLCIYDFKAEISMKWAIQRMRFLVKTDLIAIRSRSLMGFAQLIGSYVSVSITILYGWQNFQKWNCRLLCHPEWALPTEFQKIVLCMDQFINLDISGAVLMSTAWPKNALHGFTLCFKNKTTHSLVSLKDGIVDLVICYQEFFDILILN